MEETNDAMMMTSHMTCVKFIVTMTFAVQMLTYVGAKIGANSGEIAMFLNHLFGKITN